MRIKHERSWYIPAEAKRLPTGEIDVEAYAYIDKRKRMYALAFIGKAQKPTWHFRFNSAERMAAKVKETIDNRRKTLDYNAARKAEKTAKLAKPHALMVGTVLRNSWGYDQTNIDFFEVVELRGKRSVIIREIGQDRTETAWAQGTCTPVRGSFIGEPMLKRVDENNAIKIHSWGSWAYPWEGNVSHWTAYA